MATVPSPTSSVSRPQFWFLAALVVVFAAASVQYSLKALQNRSAILRWREQLLSLDVGDKADIYEHFNYPNPPIMALMLRPIAELPPLAGALTWYFVRLALALASLALVFRLVESPGRPFPPWAKALTVLLSLRPILGDLSHGNVNLLILFLVLAALFAYRHGRDSLAGVALGLAIACKVTPLLFVPYFLWKRSWKVLFGCAAGLVLFLFLVPGLALGMADNVEYLHSWYTNMVHPYVVGGVVTSEHQNQSMPGLLQRLLTASPSFSTFVGGTTYVPTAYHNLAALDPAVVRWLMKGFMGFFALLVVWRCRTPTQPRVGWRLSAEFALVVLGMLLFSERTWKHHAVTLVLPFGVLSYHLAQHLSTGRPRAYLVGTLVATVLLMTSTSTSLPGWAEGAKLAQVYGAYVWAYVLLAAALFVALRPEHEDSAARTIP